MNNTANTNNIEECNDDDMFVDFSDCVTTISNPKKLYDKNYDDTTTKFYRAVRETQLNVIMQDNTGFNPERSFKFAYKWDPYTGIREGLDPYGPLYFHPDDLIHYFYMKRLNMLWTDQIDENGGVYEGYYGDALGSSDNIMIKSRGTYPETYLFRLPIVNCYLEKGYDMSIITMGPRLTDEEVIEIDETAENVYKNNYKELYGKRRPSLRLMKNLYDQAISDHPDLARIPGYNPNKKISVNDLDALKYKANRLAVDALRKM